VYAADQYRRFCRDRQFLDEEAPNERDKGRGGSSLNRVAKLGCREAKEHKDEDDL
jgi:hypothetical protein